MMLVAGTGARTPAPADAYRLPLRVQTINAVSRPITDRNFTSRRIIGWILLSSFVWKARTFIRAFPFEASSSFSRKPAQPTLHRKIESC
jgi:hypothetical protein